MKIRCAPLKSLLLCLAAGAALASSQQTQPSAALPVGPDRFRAEIHQVENSLPAIADHGAALYFLANLHARLGDSQKALDLLRQCPIDEGFDPAGVRAFHSLESNREFQSLIARIHRRFPPVHSAHLAFTVPVSDLFPEGITADPSGRFFYMGSEYHNKIVRITPKGAMADFVPQRSYDLMPVGGVHVDPADRSVWAATDPGPKDRSELLHFDARGKLLERDPAPGAGPHDLNDLVLRDTREIYVTDTYASQVYRFDRRSRRFSTLEFPRPIFYPNGITLAGDGNILYVADMLGVLRVDLRSGLAQQVQPDGHLTLAGIDGLYWYRGGLVGIQYGAGANRVVRWRLDPAGLRVVSARMLEFRTPMVDDPTTGAIVDDDFYFMANTGIDNLDDDGIVDRSKLAPVRVSVLRLPE